MDVENNIIVLVRSGLLALSSLNFSAPRQNMKNPNGARDDPNFLSL